jgi:hypothetical protein
MIELSSDDKEMIINTRIESLFFEKTFLEKELSQIEHVELSESAKAYINQIYQISEKINYLQENLDNLV